MSIEAAALAVLREWCAAETAFEDAVVPLMIDPFRPRPPDSHLLDLLAIRAAARRRAELVVAVADLVQHPAEGTGE